MNFPQIYTRKSDHFLINSADTVLDINTFHAVFQFVGQKQYTVSKENATVQSMIILYLSPETGSKYSDAGMKYNLTLNSY